MAEIQDRDSYRNFFTAAFGAADQDFITQFAHFACDDVIAENTLDERTRWLAVLAALTGCQGLEAYRSLLPLALENLTPVEVKEMIYQAVAYLGMGRVWPFFTATNDIFTQLGISLPLPAQSVTAAPDRQAAGSQAQVDIFGSGMKDFYKSGPQETRHINRWLAENCFGDYYTRKGLDLRERELITFCFIAAQGGCEPQLTAHARGNMNIGNDRTVLIATVSQCLPFIGYPRSLNALQCINAACN